MKTLVFTNYKGGVSKTTSVLSIGAAMAQKKLKVLLVDLDPQHNLTQSLGIKEFNKGSYHALLDGEIESVIEIKKNLSLIPGSSNLQEAEIVLSAKFQREFSLRKALNPIKENYDFVLIDCPPSLGLLTINGVMASDVYIVPVEPEALARNGLFVLRDKLATMDATIDHIFFAKYDSRTGLHKSIVKNITEKFPDKVLNTIIRNNIKLAEAPIVEQDIFEYQKNCNGANDYKNLANELIKLYN